MTWQKRARGMGNRRPLGPPWTGSRWRRPTILRDLKSTGPYVSNSTSKSRRGRYSGAGPFPIKTALGCTPHSVIPASDNCAPGLYWTESVSNSSQIRRCCMAVIKGVSNFAPVALVPRAFWTSTAPVSGTAVFREKRRRTSLRYDSATCMHALLT